MSDGGNLPTPSESNEVEILRERLAELEGRLQTQTEEVSGVKTGSVRCLTFGCDFGERPAKFQRDEYVKYFKDDRGNLTDRVENSTTYWHLVNHEANCPKCKAPLNHLTPGAQSAFPAGYRFQFGEPVAHG